MQSGYTQLRHSQSAVEPDIREYGWGWDPWHAFQALVADIAVPITKEHGKMAKLSSLRTSSEAINLGRPREL
jgi:hypothetical protein